MADDITRRGVQWDIKIKIFDDNNDNIAELTGNDISDYLSGQINDEVAEYLESKTKKKLDFENERYRVNNA